MALESHSVMVCESHTVMFLQSHTVMALESHSMMVLDGLIAITAYGPPNEIMVLTVSLFNPLCTNGFFLMVDTINLEWCIEY